MKTSVTFPSGYFKSAHEYLFDGSANEYACFLFSGVARQRNRLKLLGRKLVLPDKAQDYETNTPVSCKPNLFFTDSVLYEEPRENDLIKHNLSIVDIHCHPFAKGHHVGFSGTDEHWQKESVEYFFNIRKYKGYHCFIVLGENSFDGRVWYMDRRSGKARYYPLDEIIILDYPYQRWENPIKKRKTALPKLQADMLDRQISAFGKQGQIMMSRVTAGIIGVGGVGSIVVEGLTRLGVNDFILVDNDTAEISNLNRFSGMTYADAISATPKVNIAAREILKINPRAKIRTVNLDVHDPKACVDLKTADFLVLGTDNLLSRAFINEFCIQYCIPCFSVATIINAHADGSLQDIYGEYHAVIPGRESCCLNCSGIIDYHEVSYLLSSKEVRREGEKRGYVNIPGFHQPAVRPLNGVITEMALSEIHNYFCGFKEEMIEGLAYDQKRNLLHQKRFLHSKLDENIDGHFIDARFSKNGIEIHVNGEGPFEIREETDIEPLNQRFDLTRSQHATITQFLHNHQNVVERKFACPYCGNHGITGRGNNEPLADYTQEPAL